ncbi:MAG: T9SS type A sorting domain-containing protein [Candidatus Krumholzibacteria bacterium]|nr:T9SS type A sorting domain-containing protein [Candidatus Krumholzibacteria bacterium]MDH4336892.1 T9SS type A sorting domain-containing protein [Candidatus Krumholzibacteria bacterium]MDH5269223.1 T9SS type A sorting domain-containing protein [Candidatus Krumholzibacteria bacterium]
MSNRRSRWTHAALICALLLIPSAGNAGWLANGIPVVALAGDQSASHAVSDGSGGAFIVWQDARGVDADIYIQHLDRNGNALWTPDGVLVCGATGNQSRPHVAPDGAGGAIVTWDDLRIIDSHIYARRVDASGTPLWTPDGNAVCTAPGYHAGNQILSDGAGGAFITWNFGFGGSTDIYMQRIDSGGNDLWTTNGVVVSAEANYQYNPRLASDDAGGVVLAWGDNRDGTWRIYGGHVNAGGSQLWMLNGTPLSGGTVSATLPTLNVDRDGTGGMIVGWKTGGGAGVQRASAGGVPQWQTTGIPISALNAPAVAGDGAGGAFVVWDSGPTADADVHAQRFTAAGDIVWVPNGIVLAATTGSQNTPLVALDGIGGVVATWSDTRNGGFPQLFAQRVDIQTAQPSWATNGVPVSLTPSLRTVRALLVADGAGMISLWDDGDVSAQRFHSLTGAYGAPDALLAGVTDVPGDEGGFVQVDWDASDRDNIPMNLVTYYSLWRATDFVPAGAAWQVPAGFDNARVKSRGDVAADFQGVARYIETTPAGTYYWEWVGNTTAFQWPSYSANAPTRQDATAGDPALHYFQVLAHTTNAFVFWESDVVTGSSTDDLAPAAPLSLTAVRDGSNVDLQWSPSGQNEPDLEDYAIYRSDLPGVAVDPLNFVGSTTNLTFTDTGVPLSALYYVVVARDVHDNESVPSNEAMTATPTGINTPAIGALTVRPNTPNPFNASTRFSVGLPGRSAATIEVFDVAGQRVSLQRVAQFDAGWNEISFDGRGDNGRPLPSGVYFWRVTAGSESRVRKIVLQR